MSPITAYSKRDDVSPFMSGPFMKIMICVVVLIIIFAIGCVSSYRARRLKARSKVERDIVDLEQPNVDTGVQPVALEHAPTYVSNSDPPPVYSK